MEGINREYATRVHKYVVAMVYFEELLNKGEITIEDYIEIERKIAFKYKMEESIFRLEKRACDYAREVEKIEL